MTADAGLAYITRLGDSNNLAVGRFHRLGRLEGEPQRAMNTGVVTATVFEGERGLQRRLFYWEPLPAPGQFMPASNGTTWDVSADSGLTLGDVSGNVVSGVAYGPIGGPFGTPAGFVAGVPTAFVASDTWAVALGPTPASSHVPVLRIGGRIFVAWLELDGGVRTRVLNAIDGGL